MKTLSRALLAATIVIALSGCAAQAELTTTPTASETPTPTPTAMSDSSAMKEFKAAVAASMAKADSSGLTEITHNDKWGEYTLVLDRKYNTDYNAAVANADGTYELIFEAYAFSPWAADESITLGAKVKWDATTSEFVLTQEIEGDPVESRYKVENGLIVAQRGHSSDSTWVSTLTYAVDAAGHKIIDLALETLG